MTYFCSVFVLEGSDLFSFFNSPVGWKQSCNLRRDRGGWYAPSNQWENMLITGEDSFSSWFLTIKVSSELLLGEEYFVCQNYDRSRQNLRYCLTSYVAFLFPQKNVAFLMIM
jgi:hypothetical protein